MKSILRRLRGNHIPRERSIALPEKASSEVELRERLAELGTWMYRFDLGLGVETALHDEYLEGVHQTRWSMIEPELQRAFSGRWGSVRALDVACNEGWFAFKVAGLGASEVVGFDARDVNVRKAQFVQAQLGVTNVSFQVDNVFNVGPQRYGTFDAVLCLGLMYHLEDPMGALRRLRAVTRELCVIETEVARAGSSVTIDRGPGDGLLTTGDVVVVMAEPEFQWNPLSSVTGISLVPSLSALLTMLKHAGFREVTQAQPPPDAVDRYAGADRVVLFARA